MPRLARLDSPGVLHHVMGRDIEGNQIFLSDVDRVDFIDRLSNMARDKAPDNESILRFLLRKCLKVTMFLLVNYGQGVVEGQWFKPGAQNPGSVSGSSVIPVLMLQDTLVLRTPA